MGSPEPPRQGLYFPDRGAIELAWKAVHITGDAPLATPFLNMWIDALPPRNAAYSPTVSAWMEGEHALAVRDEIVASLGFVATHLTDKPEMAAAAKILQEMMLQPDKQ